MPQANWSIIENGMIDWEEFKLTFTDLDLLQEGWASSKKTLHHILVHILKCKKGRNQLGKGPRKAQTGIFSVKETDGQGSHTQQRTTDPALNTSFLSVLFWMSPALLLLHSCGWRRQSGFSGSWNHRILEAGKALWGHQVQPSAQHHHVQH